VTYSHYIELQKHSHYCRICP